MIYTCIYTVGTITLPSSTTTIQIAHNSRSSPPPYNHNEYHWSNYCHPLPTNFPTDNNDLNLNEHHHYEYNKTRAHNNNKRITNYKYYLDNTPTYNTFDTDYYQDNSSTYDDIDAEPLFQMN